MRRGDGRRGRWATLATLIPLAALALSLAQCGSEAEAPVESAAAPDDVRSAVLWGGCTEVRLAPPDGRAVGCTLTTTSRPGARTPGVMLWVPSRVSEPVVHLGQQVLAQERGQPIDDGWSFLVRLPQSGTVVLHGVVDGEIVELLTLEVDLRPPADGVFMQDLDRATDLAARERLERRERELLAASGSAEQRLLHQKRLSYVLFDQGRWVESAQHAVEAAEVARALGRPMDECGRAWSAIYLYAMELGQSTRARQVLEAQCNYGPAIPDVAMMGSYYEGLVELQMGRLPSARRSLERSVVIARRLQVTKQQWVSAEVLVDALVAQGRFAWASQLLEGLHPRTLLGDGRLRRCLAQTSSLERQGQLAFRRVRLQGGSAKPARELWQRAQQIYEDQEQCPDHPRVREQAARLATDFGDAALHDAEFEEARRWLARVDLDVLTRQQTIHHAVVSAQLELDRGAVERARVILVELGSDDEAETGAEPEDRWRRLLLEARVAMVSGDLELALVLLDQARQKLRQDAAAVGSGLEADRLAAMRRRGGQLEVRVLMEQGRTEAAVCAARLARIAGLAVAVPTGSGSGSAERAQALEDFRWYHPDDIPVDERMALLDAGQEPVAEPNVELHCGELPRPSEAEVSILLFEDMQQWLGMAWDASGEVLVEPLGLGDSSVDLDRLEPLLVSARSARVLATSSLLDRVVLRWRGEPLEAALAVRYGLDLPRPFEPESSRPAGTVAMVLSDPRRELKGSGSVLDQSFSSWSSRLRDAGLSIAFEYRSSARTPHLSVADLQTGTEGVQLALLYGFGSQQPGYLELMQGRVDGSQPDQRSFDLGITGLGRSDIVMHSGRSPQHVLLAHCDSAAADPDGSSGAIGLAQSYVQAGAQWAVGTTTVVSPETMERAVTAVIEAYAEDPSDEHIARTLHAIARHLRDQGFDDGDRLRVWIP